MPRKKKTKIKMRLGAFGIDPKTGRSFAYKPGSVQSVDEKVAQAWIKQGTAIPHETGKDGGKSG